MPYPPYRLTKSPARRDSGSRRRRLRRLAHGGRARQDAGAVLLCQGEAQAFCISASSSTSSIFVAARKTLFSLPCEASSRRRGRPICPESHRPERTLRKLALGVTGALVAASPLLAHHDWLVDGTRTITITGTGASPEPHSVAFVWSGRRVPATRGRHRPPLPGGIRMVIRRVSPLSCAKVAGVLYAISC
jgi:hypothetical protein